MPPRHLLASFVAVAAAASLTACGDQGGAGGIVGGPVGGAVGVSAGTSTSAPAGTTTTGGPVPPAPTTTVPPTGAPSSTRPAGRLRLDGGDLGVTRVGAPFREAVAAVSVQLGRPSGDPAPDTACIGAEEEATWGSFRLANSGGRLSGWRSTSKTLATPAGVTVGTTLSSLRQAYGDRLEVRPPPEPDGVVVFVVSGADLGGTLTGQTPSDTVSSLVNGTCEQA